MTEIEKHIVAFRAISLKGLSPVKLAKRIDTKYVLNTNQLYNILDSINNDYQILQIEDKRMFQYETVYFDTFDYQFYLDHHNGYIHRMKVREREYVDSGLKFYEVKRKTSLGETDKTRVAIDVMDDELTQEQYALIKNYQRLRQRTLEKKLVNKFQRITLANVALQERITIDMDIQFIVDDEVKLLKDIVIIELKQQQFNVLSPMVKMLKKLYIHPDGFSKYAMGVALMDLHKKKNEFKPQILKIKKLQAN
ncbi:MAG: polyphosphate polymerase domain-containing protein [Chitinophagales bacterium]|nr:polyphosphate polymerase domain-containing protein [Chitinophagales bacterium]